MGRGRRAAVAAWLACCGVAGGQEPPSGGEVLLRESTVESEQAVERGLSYLARTQAADGSWGASGGEYRVAMTALAGLAFLAHGDTPERGEHRDVVRHAVEFILASSDSVTGLLSTAADAERSMYGHGFATLFLAETYGMTGRGAYEDRIRQALQRAVDLSVRSQSRDGGWYYSPTSSQDEGSVTITQVQGLRAAHNVGIEVPRASIARAIHYIRDSQNPDGGIRYRVQGGGEGRPAITAAGMAVIFHAGEYTEETRGMLDRGLEYLRRTYGANPVGGPSQGHFFYTHFYLAQGMFLSGRDDWDRYFPPVRDHLVSTQHPDGAWRQEVGDAYATAIACFLLEMPSRLLPILQE